VAKIKIRWTKHVAEMGEMRDTYRILVRKYEWKRPFGRKKRRWKNNIEMGFNDI
jgi:hypothetical protein